MSPRGRGDFLDEREALTIDELHTTAPLAERELSMKRIALFLLTNLAVMVVLSIVLKVFGIDRAMAQEGFNLGPLLAFSAVFGFGGAIISLLISKPMAKWSTGAGHRRQRGLDPGVARRNGAAARATGQHQHAGCGDLRRRAQRARPVHSRTRLWLPSRPDCCNR